MLAEVYAQSLILPADEDGAEDVAANKNNKKNIMQATVAEGVENGKENEPGATGNCEDDAEGAVDLLPYGGVGREFAGVTEIAFKNESGVEGHHCHGGHGDEEGLEALCTDVL